jgi:hypothetical protein
MQIINYKGDYITPYIVEQCFKDNTHNFIDKTITGNGFTTAYISIKPSKKYQSNIIIVPNREVILSKRDSYKKDYNLNKTKIGFIFGDADSDRISFKDFDVLMFVIDSFVDRIDYLKKYTDCIDKILIDEMHSMYIQSEFRKKLKFFDEVLSDNFRSIPKASVSATPMLFQSIDIKINKELKEYRNINVTENINNSLNRLKEGIVKGNKIIVASHNAQLIASLSNKKNILKANFKTGVSLKKSLVELCTIEHDEESNLTIISSAGFEGFDILNGVNDVFIYEDRAYDFSTFYFQNILQIIGRSRLGTNYIEYCRNSHSEGRTYFDKEQMNKVVNSTRISFEKKMTDKNYYYIPKFYYPLLDKETDGFIKDLVLDDITYNLYTEKQQSDVKGVSFYKQYAKDRGFNIVSMDEGVSRKKLPNVKEKTKYKFIKSNIDFIQKNGVYKDVRLNLLPKNSAADYVRELKKFFRRKYYNRLSEIEDFKDFNIDRFIQLNINESEGIGYRFLVSALDKKSENNLIIPLVDEFSQKFKVRKLKEYKNNYAHPKYIEEIKQFKEVIHGVILQMVLAFTQESVRVPVKKRVWRDYNVFTESSLFVAEEIGKKFDKIVHEVDIVTCNPRILYAYCGLKLPSDFYGENKKNKKGINILLNSLSKEYAESKKMVIRKRKETISRQLHQYNFDEKVITFLGKFWNRPKDSLFNWCAYHEEKIINKLKSNLINVYGKEMFSYSRRHDSILIIGESQYKQNANNVDSHLVDFEYLNQLNWFVNTDVKNDNIREFTEEEINEFEEKLRKEEEEEINKIKHELEF